VGVSPEFGGSGFGAWGRNASFQLAALHFLCRALIQASEELGVDYDRRQVWLEIERRLPIGAIGEGPELLLWEGQPLTESHRHHSHLAAIYPFDLLDPQSDRHRALVRNSMRRLTRMGMGLWTGWCLPWASILWARMGNGDMASLLLEVFRRFFMGPGYASTHDARQPGITVFDGRPDVMQVEAAEAAAAAVLEMLVHTCGGTLRVFPAVPTGWTGASFERVRAEGAFLVSGEWEAGRALRVQIRSEAGALLRLANPWGDDGVRLTRGTQTPVPIHRRILEIPTVAGEHLEFTPLL